MNSLNLVAYLVAPYDSFHRRPLIRALGRAISGHGGILCVEPWVRRLSGARSLRQAEENVYVYQPHVLPHESALHCLGVQTAHWRSNAKRLRRAIAEVMGSDGMRVAWAYKPEQLWLAGLADETHLVYECYDEYRFDMAGRQRPEICDLETKLLRAADLVFITSEELRPARSALNDSVNLLPTGVDFELFSSPEADVPADLAALPRPRIGHVGNLMACLDLDLLRGLVASRPQWSFVHIGPVAPTVDIAGLRKLPNFHLLGRKPQAEVPAYLRGLDAGLILFKPNRFTSGVDPLKLYEYLATGIPVVSTRFAPLGPAKDIVWTAGGLPEFVERLELALACDDPARRQAGIELARSRNWPIVAQQAIEALATLRAPLMAAA